MEKTVYDVLIVGGGAAGLTSAAYLSRQGYSVLLAEASHAPGGLVNSFEVNGFLFDGGIRAFENSGIIFPMLRELGIAIDFVKNPVVIGIGDHFAPLTADTGLADYGTLLTHAFPESAGEIDTILEEIKKAVSYMDVLYGIDNPLFGDALRDKKYLVKTLLPWLLRYKRAMKKVKRLGLPINQHLSRLTGNKALIDMITQHFFKETPASFALSYFSQYLDYSYPRGGTGVLAERLTEKISEWGGILRTGTRIVQVDLLKHETVTSGGETIGYKKLIWACDMKSLYEGINLNGLKGKAASAALKQKENVLGAQTGDSILTVFAAVSRGTDFFESQVTAHSFYTPDKTGLSNLPSWESALAEGQSALKKWLADYLALTTYEISIPALRDASLAPAGNAGLMISTLIDYALVAAVRDQGWYDEFKALCTSEIVSVLDRSAFPLDTASVTDAFCATPLTLERLTSNSGGAVTGWAFTNTALPALHQMQKIAKAIVTPLPDVLQAGHWTFSPSGLPIAVLTGKLAADATDKALKKEKNRKRP